MTAPMAPAIGGRLRQERQRRGVSVRGLARDVGVSASLISQIETDRKSPSVSTLYAITMVLGISVEELFASEPGSAVTGPVAAKPEVAGPEVAGPEVAGTSRSGSGGSRVANGCRPAGPPPVVLPVAPFTGPVGHPGGRKVLTLDSGVTWEQLGQIPHVHVEFLLITYQPGGASSSSGLLMRHSGTEYGYVISGQLTLTLGFEDHLLGPGDSVCFDSATPHGYRNDGDEPAVGVWLGVEPQ